MSDQPVTIPPDARPVITYHAFYRPRATYVILALNLAIFLLMTRAGGSMNPEVLLGFGASYGPYFRRGEYWRLVMPMFLHIGLLHLLINGFALFILGSLLERVYGYGRFTLLYVGAGAAGSFLSMMRSDHAGGGASGAIFGIMGALLVLTYLRRQAVSPRWARAIRRGIVPTIVFNLALGFFIPFIDKWAHFGGLAGGLLVGALVPVPGPRPMFAAGEESPSQAILAVPVIVVAWAMAATVNHYQVARVATRLLEEGRQLRRAHQNPQAVQRLQEAARRAPRDERPHEQLGSLYLEEKRADDAIREFDEALRLNPDLPQAELGLVQAYRQKGDLAKAQRLLEAVVGKNPLTTEAQRALADLCAERKLYDEAVKHYEQALRLSPSAPEVHNNLAWLLATAEDPNFRNPRAALDHAHLAVELTRWKQPEFVDTLAEAYYANRNFAEAVRVQTKALELAPNRREYQEHMARYRKAAGA